MRDIPMHYFWMSLLVMAGVTYLIRAVPFTLCRKKVENRFVKSFLAYVPYAVLGAMTFPAIIYSADKIAAGVFHFLNNHFFCHHSTLFFL